MLPPEGGWEPRCFYIVEVAFHETNPRHLSLFYSGFLSDSDAPSGYNAIFNPSYDRAYMLSDVRHFRVVQRLGPLLEAPITTAVAGESPEDRLLRLCRAAGAQLEADNKAAYEKYSAAIKEIEKEFSSGEWPWYKV